MATNDSYKSVFTGPEVGDRLCKVSELEGSASLSLPSSVSWSGGTAPTWESGKTYQISIVNNIAAYLSI